MFFSFFMLLPVLLFAVSAAAVTAIAAANAKNQNTKQTGTQSPAVTLTAQITKKQSFVNQTQVGAPIRHFMTFVTPEGAVLELEVPADAFEAFHEGESGDLCVQGRVFLGFVPQALPFDAQAYPQESSAQTGTGFPGDGFGQRMQ